jgi:phosphate transport system protein
MAAAQQVIADDDLIDRAQDALEERALTLIARQAPLATDLRLISAVIAIAGELERIGDYAEGIAKLVVQGGAGTLLPPPQIAEMAQRAPQVVQAALAALVQRDVAAAYRVAADEAVVDQLTSAVYAQLLVHLGEPAHVESALRLFFVTHNLERVADRATNIAERVIFVVTGELVHLQRGR